METEVVVAIVTSGVALIVGIFSIGFQTRSNSKNRKAQLELERVKAELEMDKIKLQNELSMRLEMKKRFDELKGELHSLIFNLGMEFGKLQSRWGSGTFNEGVE